MNPQDKLVSAEQVRLLIERERAMWGNDFGWGRAAHASFDTITAELSALPTSNAWRDIAEAPKGQKLILGYRNKLGNWRTITGTYYLPETLDCSEDSAIETEDGFASEGWYEESETLGCFARRRARFS